ncbi:MAG TPA: DEAD/DEAH box helicase [Polyangiaceae bacterium]|nr:DEAD/DEAH box helicase [Polyangiaceae bacterium]
MVDAEIPPTFEILNLSKETLEVLTAMGYTHPTPVQRAVFDPAVRGSDLVVQARTGTGKTAAFGLPIVETVVRRNLARLQVIILCPTRELALQVCAEIDRLGRARNIKPIAIYGGAPMGRQIDALAAGAQVVVGTPGRVLDHLHRGTLDPSEIRMLVLDEADEMLSMGFERELSSILERLPKGRQTLLFSATIPPDIERMARDRLRAPEFITLSGDHVGALEVVHFVYLSRGDKLQALTRILEVENPESAIIFCNTKVETERVAEALERQGFTAAWLNGDLPQGEREQVMSSTREGKLRFLVATDVAARGIDISHLTHVINHDFPDATERYIHRTGRTGRAGRTGTAISIITPKDIGNLYLLRLTYKIRPIEKQLPTAGELKTREEADLVQMLADAFLTVPAHPEDLALARRLFSHDSAEHIVAGLLRDHLGARPEAVEEAAAARRSKVVKSPTPAPDRAEAPPPAPSGPLLADTQDQMGAAPTRGASAGTGAGASAGTGAGAGEPAVKDVERSQDRSLDRGRPRRDRPARRTKEGDEDALRITWVEEPQFAAADGTFAEIFVNIGRQDGVSAPDLQRVLTETAAISRADTGRIRVRDRSSFVSVKREFLTQALAALNGASFSGKACQAEPARARSAGTSSPNDG